MLKTLSKTAIEQKSLQREKCALSLTLKFKPCVLISLLKHLAEVLQSELDSSVRDIKKFSQMIIMTYRNMEITMGSYFFLIWSLADKKYKNLKLVLLGLSYH